MTQPDFDALATDALRHTEESVTFRQEYLKSAGYKEAHRYVRAALVSVYERKKRRRP